MAEESICQVIVIDKDGNFYGPLDLIRAADAAKAAWPGEQCGAENCFDIVATRPASDLIRLAAAPQHGRAG